jgi:hypothetical protein
VGFVLDLAAVGVVSFVLAGAVVALVACRRFRKTGYSMMAADDGRSGGGGVHIEMSEKEEVCSRTVALCLGRRQSQSHPVQFARKVTL